MIPRLVASAFAMGLALTGCEPPVRETAEAQPAPAREELPRVVFPIGGFSSVPERDKEAGFTIAGPAYRNKQEVLAQCEAVGLPFIYPIGVEVDFLGRHGDAVRDLDMEAVRAEVRAQVEEVMESDMIFAWYLTPEELRNWRPLEMEYLEEVSRTIRETDPKQRPVWMYEPNHRGAGSLEKTFPFQQLVGKGFYANYSSRKNERAWIAWSFDAQERARRAVSPEAKSFAVLEMFREPEEDETDLIPAWVRHDCYLSLVSGAEGIVIFSFGRRRNFPSLETYHAAYAEIARELNDEPGIGAVFLEGERVAPPEIEVLSGPESVTLGARRTTPKEPVEVPALYTGAYSIANRDFLFIVNSSPEPMELHWKDAGQWKSVFSADTPEPGANDRLVLPPWGVAGLEHQP